MYGYTNKGKVNNFNNSSLHIFLLKAPLYFPASNSSADYTSNNWMNPCYERYYEVGALYIAYWIVNGDMYCEALVQDSPNKNQPSFGQDKLFRTEYKKTWCPPKT
uniref:Uncharacterized protein n=1 Tax=Caenorhabditis japonica TaxID=281687 RepID=A0A8R1HY61_CAEJA